MEKWNNNKVICKNPYSTKTVIDRIFNRCFTEYQNYSRFGNLVCHARISDDKVNYPNCGFDLQNEIEFNESREKERIKRQEERIKIEKERIKREEKKKKEEEKKKKQGNWKEI